MMSDDAGGGGGDFTSFDELVESLARWSNSLSDWAPARRVRAAAQEVRP